MPMNAGGLGYWRHKAQAIVLLVFGRHAAAEAVFDTMLQLWPGDARSALATAHANASNEVRRAVYRRYGVPVKMGR